VTDIPGTTNATFGNSIHPHLHLTCYHSRDFEFKIFLLRSPLILIKYFKKCQMLSLNF